MSLQGPKHWRSWVGEALRSPSRPLDAQQRAQNEKRFGIAFDHVRVHSGDVPASSARALSARAYTVANHIVLGSGVTPSDPVIAHELAHVAQQRPGTIAKEDAPLGGESDLVEHRSDMAEEAVTRGAQIGPLPRIDDGRIRRKPSVPGTQIQNTPSIGADVTILLTTDDAYSREMMKYFQQLPGATGVDDAAGDLETLIPVLEDVVRKRGPIGRLRLIAHAGKSGLWLQSRRVSPAEVAKLASDPKIRKRLDPLLVPQASIELWACELGQSSETDDLANLFRRPVAAPTLFTSTDVFVFPVPRAHEKDAGVELDKELGRWVRSKSTKTSHVAARSVSMARERSADGGQTFEKWLRDMYKLLRQLEEVPVVPEEKRLAYMQEMFDRTQGALLAIHLETSKRDIIARPKDAKWIGLWKVSDPRK